MKKRMYQKSEKRIGEGYFEPSKPPLNPTPPSERKEAVIKGKWLKETIITGITEITEGEDKKFLTFASTSTEMMRKMLLQIEDGTITFIGQYAKSRKEEALDYLRRTVIEREG